MTLLYSNYMIECQQNYNGGTSLLRAAKKLEPSRVDRYIIFVRDQEHMTKVHQQSASESTVDLVGYVEFQRNFR